MSSLRLGQARSRAEATYRATVLREFGWLKGTRTFEDAVTRGLPFGDGAGHLVPVCALHAGDERTVALLARWRAEHAQWFPTQFRVTREGTARWLQERVLDVPDRVLFLALDRTGHPVGHAGLADATATPYEVWVDNVLRGEAAPPGFMTMAVAALERWAWDVLGARRCRAHVVAGNQRSLRLWHRLGYEEVSAAEGALVEVARTRGDGDEPSRPILTAGPSISGREPSYALAAARTAWDAGAGRFCARFERDFADYVGVRHAIATSSCTGALHLGLAALELRPGDEVIVPDLTWVASANAVVLAGGTPVFADVDPDTWCLDPAACAAAITARTRAVMPVHLYGQPAPMEEIVALAERHGLAVVEDAAPAVGAEVAGRRVGTFGQFAAFSFQGAKLLVTGEGGMLVTDDDGLAARARHIWDQRRAADRAFWIDGVSPKYKMADVQAAIGLGQLERVDSLIEAKRRVFETYAEELAGVPGLRLVDERPGTRSIHWMTCVELLDDAATDRDGLAAALAAGDVDSRPVFPAVSSYGFWAPDAQERPHAARAAARGLNLPSGVRLGPAEIRHVAGLIRGALR